MRERWEALERLDVLVESAQASAVKTFHFDGCRDVAVPGGGGPCRSIGAGRVCRGVAVCCVFAGEIDFGLDLLGLVFAKGDGARQCIIVHD